MRVTRIASNYTLKDAHKAYRKTIEKKSIYDVKESTYVKVCADINTLMVEALITGKLMSHRVAPYLGTFEIEKQKTSSNPKRMRVDWKRTKELGFMVYHENEHTNGYYCRWRWRKSKVMANRKKYFFRLLRRHDRYMSAKFRSGQVDYPVTHAQVYIDKVYN